MKLKKLSSLTLVIVMVLALAVPAFATTYNDKQNQSVTMKGGTQVPKIQILLPSGAALTNSFLLNPYKISYSGATAAIGGYSTVSGNGGASAPQVISPVLQITNATNSKMQVDVTVTTTLGGNLKLMTANFTDDDARKNDTKNNAFLFLNLTNSSTKLTTATITAPTYNDTKSIVLKAGDVKTTGALYTDEASESSPKYINIQFGGAMAEAPSTPWTDKDVATVALAFTFTPNQNVTVST